PDGPRLLPARADGPRRPRGQADRRDGTGPAALHLRGPGRGLRDLLAALRGAADPAGLRIRSRGDARGGRRPAGRSLGPLLHGGAAARPAGTAHRHRARLRAHGRRVRGGADDRGQHPGRDARALGRRLRPCRGDRLRGRAPALGWPGGVRAAGAPRAVPAQPDPPDREVRPVIEASLRLERTGFALDVDIAAPRAGISALFGPSGCGKTTVLRAIAGLVRARGRVALGDEAWQDDARGIFVPTHRRSIGYVVQEAALFPHMSVRRNLEYGLRRAEGQ